MRDLLFLVHRLPYPPNKGDKIRSWHMLQYLSRHFRVHLGCFVDDEADWQHARRVADLCASTRFIDLRALPARWRALQALLARQSMSVQYYRDERLLEWVAGVLSTGRVRHALAFSGPMAQYLDGGAAAGQALHRVIDFVDVDSDKWRQYGDSKPWPVSLLYRREAQLLQQYERHIAQQFAAASFVSQAEASLFRLCAPLARRKTHYVNNGVDTGYFAPGACPPPPYPSGAQVLVFTGAMDYWPNVDAMQWFVRSVWPALRRQFPQLALYIVGSRPVARVRALGRVAGVTVTGTVDDIRPYLQGAALAVAPLRIARGVQNKVLEAMAMGKIVLASPQALEGIAAQPGLELLLARDEAEFIHHAARVLRAGTGAGTPGEAMGAAARQFVVQDYNWERNLQALGAMLQVAAQAHPATVPAIAPAALPLPEPLP